MGAGRRPLAAHPPRPPIPMRPLDAGAMAAARARQEARSEPPGALGRLDELAIWLAGVTGAEPPPLRARIVVAGADRSTEARLAALGTDAGPPAPVREADIGELVLIDAARLPPSRDPAVEPALSVGEVAAAVDLGRELAAHAAADGVTVLAAAAVGPAGTTAPTCLTALLTRRDPAQLVGAGDERAVVERALALHGAAARGPLGALRRVGDGAIAVLCGLALGAGEHGLAFVCDGAGATAAAAVAVAVEPDLRPRLLAADRSAAPAHAALLEHLGLEPVVDLDDGPGAAAALAVLRQAGADRGRQSER